MTARKSAEIHRMSGAASRNPGRVKGRAAAPAVVGTPGSAPDHLDAAAQAVWAELIASAPPGILGRGGDLILLELVSAAIAAARSRKWAVAPNLMLRIERLLDRLGLIPDRLSGTGVPPNGPTKPNDRFFAD